VKILLDENLDWRLKRDLPGHSVESVPLIGWSGLKNGELLIRAEGSYDVFLTMDKGIPHQQYLARYKIAVVGLGARSNRLADTRPLMPKVLSLLPVLKHGTYTVVA
jgi:hypothetical protein